MATVPRMNEQESAAWLSLISLLELLPAALDAQLQRDARLTHFEYVLLTMLQRAPKHVMRMKALAAATSSTLPRLSHVVSRLEGRGLVERYPCEEDRRATNARLTPEGRRTVIRATPEHIATVRRLVIDVVSPEQLDQIAAIGDAILPGLDPERRLTRLFDGDVAD
ncbi:MarR family winged helix-turn-helix transcriptional regulator [Salinibacterium soli]|uniref:MarR family transcriptional regulator n=1 Tax=Antiquaquibacter soli TaxID=3064523 RepID=A0ABT9BRM6_9MICO|nr:MarR family transcriptional regulator [Protaetiibacter sp. WY-16]MDO7883087.1 MarR family transcriptional regulator [Protaetiibacter sp. WY-16]